MEFLVNIPTGYVGSAGEVVVFTGQAVDSTTGVLYNAVSSNVNPSNTNQLYLLLNNPTTITGTFIINVSLTTEIFSV